VVESVINWKVIAEEQLFESVILKLPTVSSTPWKLWLCKVIGIRSLKHVASNPVVTVKSVIGGTTITVGLPIPCTLNSLVSTFVSQLSVKNVFNPLM